MRLDSVKLVVPPRILTNDDVVALVRRHSAETYSGDLDRLLETVHRLLCRSGAERRHWQVPGEDVLALINRAVRQAVDAAGCSTSDIDLLIYSSVDRRFVEPATAYLMAQALDLRGVACFDVVDACSGWVRSLQLLHGLFRSGTCRRALVLNAEFPMFDGGPIYPQMFSLRDRDELAWAFAGYTVGEGVTATVLSADPERDWEFHNASRPDLADLSTIPLPGYRQHAGKSERIGRAGVGHFVAYSGEMFAQATTEVSTLFQCLKAPVGELRAVIPHGATMQAWDEGAELLGVRHLLVHVYPRYGNLVSASIPAGLVSAIEAKRVARGDRVAVCSASAGMSFSVCSFVY